MGLDEAEAHFNLAYLELQKGNQQGAITEDNEVLRIDPRYPGARLSLAVSLYETGEYVRAQEILGGLGATEPLLASIRHYPGLALLKLGEAEAAVPELQAAIRLRPDNPESQFALGRALRGIGRHQEAVEAMRAARRAPQVGRNGLYEGEILREPSAATHGSRDLDAAADKLREALGVNGNDRIALNLEMLLIRKGSFDDAVQVLRGLIRRKRDLPLPHYHLGLAFARMRRFPQAGSPSRPSSGLSPNILYLKKESMLYRWVRGWTG